MRASKDLAAPCPESEPECSCGALGQIGEGRMSVQADPLRRSLIEAGTQRIYSALSCRTQPPGKRERLTVSRNHRFSPGGFGTVPGTTRRVATVLSSASGMRG